MCEVINICISVLLIMVRIVIRVMGVFGSFVVVLNIVVSGLFFFVSSFGGMVCMVIYDMVI